MGATLVPANFMIILKELALEKMQLIANWSESEYADQNLSLGYGDMEETLKDAFWLINPFTYIDIFFSFFFGFPFFDLFKKWGL